MNGQTHAASTAASARFPRQPRFGGKRSASRHGPRSPSSTASSQCPLLGHNPMSGPGASDPAAAAVLALSRRLERLLPGEPYRLAGWLISGVAALRPPRVGSER